MIGSYAAIAFAVLASIVALFQAALLLGAPWGHLTLGGRFPGRLPGRMRGFAASSGVLLVLFALVVLSRAGVALPTWRPFARIAVWPVIAYCVVGIVLNSMSRSRWERILWVPVTTLMLVSSVLVVTA
jgi:hypothetical protein